MDYNITLDNSITYMLVFARMGGMFFFNPIFSRRNVNSRVRMAIVLCMTLILAPVVDPPQVEILIGLDLLLAMIRELFLGVCCSFVFILFNQLVMFAGDFMDIQFGMSMAKMLDPGTNIQASASGNMLNILFMFYVFITNSHLLMIKIFASSFMIIPAGAAVINPDISGFFVILFSTTFSLVLRLTLPFAAAEFTMEVAMGILMKLVPQIHIFVINIQMKLSLALLLLLLYAQPISEFLDKYIVILFQRMEEALYILAG